jgi:chondroitin-sulfate-ABC endolyase/exolyase
MNKKILSFLLPCALLNFTAKLEAQIYSFENGLLPTTWSVNSGNLEPSTSKFKLGSKSLSWSWNAGSTINVDASNDLLSISKTNSGGIYLWIYNTKPTDSKLVFSFLNNANQEKCHLDFKLNFKGWRCLLAGFVNDMNHDKSTLTKMKVQAPAVGSGLIYFDYLEYQKNIKWDRMSDAQYDVVQNTLMPDFKGMRPSGNIDSVKKATTTEIDAADKIIKRLENWYLSTDKYSSSPEFISRKIAVERQIKFGLTRNTADLNLAVEKDGTVSGAGLFPDYMSTKIDGIQIRKFKDIMSGCMLPLAYDYRMNKTELSKSRFINILDWFNDQGWADGSALGGLNFEKLRSAGYFHSLFLMRNELDSTRLTRELNTLNWMGKFGLTDVKFEKKGENADDIRALVVAKLNFALMQPNQDKRVAALKLLTTYLNNTYSIAPGLTETFKPDFSGYHHANPYFSAYYPEALYVASLTYYLLHDTPYALSESVFSTLKSCLLTFRTVASVYDVPVGVSGRFPTGTATLQYNVAAYAYLALSKDKPDSELLAAFGRLWKPAASLLKDAIARANTEICLRTTLGETELCLQANALKVTAEPDPKTCLFLPYSGLMINRNSTCHVSLKGFSKYIWDYESGLPSDNLYGRYVSYGQLEYTDMITKRRNNKYASADWDWSRIPGTTTKYLPASELMFNSKSIHRSFSDKSFLGGAVMNDSVSVFSMQLHDNAFDKTFYANKSVFYFGNVLVCLGSNISDSAKSVRTETTLFQQELKSGEILKVNGKLLKKDGTDLENVVIQDNIGNRFIVKTGKVDVIKKDSMAVAVINHGFAPQNQSYSYFMLLQGTDAQEKKFSNAKTCPVSIIRQDEVAHIVKMLTEKIWGYAIFNKTLLLNDSPVQQVNIPSLVMFQELGNSKFSLVVSDPDMHRPNSTSLQTLSHEIEKVPSKSFNYEIILNGKFTLDGENQNVTLTNVDNTTKIALKVIDGKSYKISLKANT